MLQHLFPAQSRKFPGQRWVNISLRTCHLLGVAGIGGGFLYHAPESAWTPYLWLAVASGAGMVAIQAWSNGIWLIQVRGLAVLAKLVLLALAAWAGASRGTVLVCVIAISGVISHAPGNVRYFSPWHRRRVDSLRD
ncbi:MAG TPA: hypothetical protein VFA86_13235 [Gammaproteobacteria bacterium]|nr:hypothetical protein [Gammaproteobacteria bacterium]